MGFEAKPLTITSRIRLRGTLRYIGILFRVSVQRRGHDRTLLRELTLLCSGMEDLKSPTPNPEPACPQIQNRGLNRLKC